MGFFAGLWVMVVGLATGVGYLLGLLALAAIVTSPYWIIKLHYAKREADIAERGTREVPPGHCW